MVSHREEKNELCEESKMPVTMGTPWYCPGILVVSFSRRVPAFALFSLFSRAQREETQKGNAKSACDISRMYKSLTMSFSDGLPISRTSIAVRNWSGSRAFIVSPTTNEIRFRVELPAILSSNVP